MMTEKEILDRLGQAPDIRGILEIIRSLELKDSWLAAGCVRNFIWNMLSERPGFDSDTDVDVIFFDPTYAEAERIELEAKLKADWPQYPGTAPYKNAREAMSKYPERCTTIGLRLLANDKLELFAPYGLKDILNFQVRPTPHFLENKERQRVYAERLAKKNWQKRWPQLEYHYPDK